MRNQSHPSASGQNQCEARAWKTGQARPQTQKAQNSPKIVFALSAFFSVLFEFPLESKDLFLA
ncbi:MAG: hypothetical protein AB7U82_17605 [Blastocatellales bacterium]